MRTTSAIKIIRVFLFSLIMYVAVVNAYSEAPDHPYPFSADNHAYSVWIKSGKLYINDSATGGSAIKTRLPILRYPALLNGGQVFFHTANTQQIVLISKYPSKKHRGMGFCGAGNEVFAHAYAVHGARLKYKGTVLIHSCLESISLPEDGSGEIKFAEAFVLENNSLIVTLAFHPKWAPGKFLVRWDKKKIGTLTPIMEH